MGFPGISYRLDYICQEALCYLPVRNSNIINFRSQNNLQDNADVIRAVQALRAEIERSIVDRDAVQLGIPRRSDERIYAMWLLRTFQALTELQE